MELSRNLTPETDCTTLHPYHWNPPPHECPKLNVDAGFKEGSAALVVLARDEKGMVRGL